MFRRSFLGLAGASIAAPAEQFTDELWRSIRPIYARTLTHPFLTGLQDGTLPRNRFQFYLIQDALYLKSFSQALLLLAANSPSKEWAAGFRKDSTEAIETEAKMHGEILASYGVAPRQVQSAAMAPTNYAYTNHLLEACRAGSFAQGLAAMLPCYWIYWEVGKNLIKKGSKNKEYQRWIQQYASEEYGKAVQRVLAILNSAITPEDRLTAKNLFITSARYEYLFWDMAWRLERWQP